MGVLLERSGFRFRLRPKNADFKPHASIMNLELTSGQGQHVFAHSFALMKLRPHWRTCKISPLRGFATGRSPRWAAPYSESYSELRVFLDRAQSLMSAALILKCFSLRPYALQPKPCDTQHAFAQAFPPSLAGSSVELQAFALQLTIAPQPCSPFTQDPAPHIGSDCIAQ